MTDSRCPHYQPSSPGSTGRSSIRDVTDRAEGSGVLDNPLAGLTAVDERMTSNPVSAALHYPRLTPVARPMQMQSRKAKPDAGARPERSRGEQLVQKTTAPP